MREGFESSIYDIAVDETHGWIYVSCPQPYPAGWQVKRFDLNGAPADFSAVEPYIEGNTITYDPGGEEEKFARSLQIEVDNSSSINQGRLFTGSSPNIDIFNPSGEYFSADNPAARIDDLQLARRALDIGPERVDLRRLRKAGRRDVEVQPCPSGGEALLHESTNGGEVFGTRTKPARQAVDTTGAIWLDTCFSFFLSGEDEFDRYEADQFTNELSLTPFGTTPRTDRSVHRQTIPV